MWEIPKHFFRKLNSGQIEQKKGKRQKDKTRPKKGRQVQGDGIAA
jgi:hypothetical protein